MSFSNVHITPGVVQAVRDAIDIVEIASEHTRLKRSGRSYTGLCPLHKEKTPSFTVDPDQGLFYCFGCGQGGDAIKLFMQLSGDDFPTAIESLASRYGIPLPTRAPRSGGRHDEVDVQSALDAAQDFFRKQLDHAGGVRRYLEKRKIPEELIERYGIGFAPDDWDALHSTLTPRISLKQLEAAGLIGRSERRDNKPYDRFRNRLMFPIRNPSGRLVGFGGRAMGDDPAKYLNSPETDRFQKRHLLFGLDTAKRSAREMGRLLIVEGYFDQLAAVAAGVDWAVASMGTSLTPEQARLAARFADEVIVGYDGDTAGEGASRRALPILLGVGLTVRRLRLKEGEDPDSLRLEQGEAALAKAIEEAPDAVAGEIERLVPADVHREPRLKARSARAVSELLEHLTDSTLRLTYGRMAATRLGIPAGELLRRRRPESPAGAQIQAPAKSAISPVRSVEEKLIQLLIGTESVDLEALPPPEAFLDAECRNIFALFCDLYRQKGGAPEAKELLGALGEEGTAVDRLAHLLVERPVSAGSGELEKALRQLGTRWRRQRLRELSLRIDEAQRTGDSARLEKLLAEKTAVSLSLHRPNTNNDPQERD